MPAQRRDLLIAIAASAAGALAGAIVASTLLSFVLARVATGVWLTLALLAGWFALSVMSGVATYMATASFTPIALPIAFSVFVWTGVLVYPGIAVYRLFHLEPSALVIVGAAIAGLMSAVLVARIDSA